MAVIWKKHYRGKCYEVRTAGHSVRLYTDGVFHSQWNSQKPLAGHLWDLLFLPLFFHGSPERVNKALVLGVGGGSVINLIRHFFPQCLVRGVDLDPIHLDLARKYFLDSQEHVDLIQAEAQKFLKSERGRYDMLVEDLFLGSAEDKPDAVKPIAVNGAWLQLLRSRLKPKGLLIINFESLKQLKGSLNRESIDDCGFSSVYALLHPRYENAIAACLTTHMSERQFTLNVADFVASKPRRQVKHLCFDVKRVL